LSEKARKKKASKKGAKSFPLKNKSRRIHIKSGRMPPRPPSKRRKSKQPKPRKGRKMSSERRQFRINIKTHENSAKTKKMRCAPRPGHPEKSYSCYTDQTLIGLRNQWNKSYPKDSCWDNDPHKIWVFLDSRLNHKCETESCWVKQPFAKEKFKQELRTSFAPKAPSSWKKNPNEWLSSDEIAKVMKQYEKTYPCFLFLGPSPIDFDKKIKGGECVWDELCQFDLQEHLKAGKNKFGFSFNTDTHKGTGEHWVSMFLNMQSQPPILFYYDSAGDRIPVRIKRLADRIIAQGKTLSPTPVNIQFDQNAPVEHQFKNSECGIYSLFFIVHMLEDKITKEYLKSHVLKDDYIEKFRDVYFNDDV